jgi:hypothetical protein
MEDYFDQITVLADPLIALVNAADGIDQSTFAGILERASSLSSRMPSALAIDACQPASSAASTLLTDD